MRELNFVGNKYTDRELQPHVVNFRTCLGLGTRLHHVMCLHDRPKLRTQDLHHSFPIIASVCVRPILVTLQLQLLVESFLVGKDFTLERSES